MTSVVLLAPSNGNRPQSSRETHVALACEGLYLLAGATISLGPFSAYPEDILRDDLSGMKPFLDVIYQDPQLYHRSSRQFERCTESNANVSVAEIWNVCCAASFRAYGPTCAQPCGSGLVPSKIMMAGCVGGHSDLAHRPNGLHAP